MISNEVCDFLKIDFIRFSARKIVSSSNKIYKRLEKNAVFEWRISFKEKIYLLNIHTKSALYFIDVKVS